MMFEKKAHLGYLKRLFENNRRKKVNESEKAETESGSNLKTPLAYWLTEQIKLNGIYWALCAVSILQAEDEILNTRIKDEIEAFILSCWDEEAGAFAANTNLDAHMLFTLSGLQALLLLGPDVLQRVLESPSCNGVTKRNAILQFVKNCQNDDGSFSGDQWGEVDTRFVYCAIQIIQLCALNNSTITPESEINIPSTLNFIMSCQNFDGGFGSIPGAESHAGQIFCCVGALKMLKSLHLLVDGGERLIWWLGERQLPKNGGLNGRPEKLEDVCYSWWVLSSLLMLTTNKGDKNSNQWLPIDREKLLNFISSCQSLPDNSDDVHGGFSDRPGNVPDVFHTLFGIAAISMLGGEGLERVNPVYCLPYKITKQYAQLIE